MPNYKKMYFRLAANIADAVKPLTEAQQKGEDSYLEPGNQENIENIGLGTQVQARKQNLGE